MCPYQFFRGKRPPCLPCPPIKNSTRRPTAQVPAAVYPEPRAAPWSKEANWRLEDSKTHCVADGAWSFTSLRVGCGSCCGTLADHDTVMGFGVAHARRLPNRIGGRFDTA